MMKPDNASTPRRIEENLEQLYTGVDPTPEFSARLRARLRQQAVARPLPRPGLGWRGFRGVAFNLALFALLLALLAFGLRLRPNPDATPAGGLTPSPSPSPTSTLAPAPAPVATAMPLPVPLVVSPGLCALPTATPPPAGAGAVDAPFWTRRPAQSLNQDTVRSGDFSFDLLLYCSPSFVHLVPDLHDISLQSEIQGLGIYASWRYDGAGQYDGETVETSGFIPYARYSGSSGPELKNGSGGETNMGISFPDEVLVDLSGASTPLRFVYTVEAPNGERAGAALSFTLQRQEDGYIPVDIQAQPLSAAELAATEYSGESLPTRDPAELSPQLAELKTYVDRLNDTLLDSPGWVHIASRMIDDQGGGMLPNGAAAPPEYSMDAWYLLAEGQSVSLAISRALYEDERLNQVSVYQDGVWENRTYGTTGRSPGEKLSNLDAGFYASAVRALRYGQEILREQTAEGVLFTIQRPDTRDLALFDPDTGVIRWSEAWQRKPEGWQRFYRTETVAMERAPSPPEDVLALVDLPVQAYQPLPPEGAPAPAGFDPSHSPLRLNTVPGDRIDAPTFFYGDVYADDYLLGRVDFGAVPGGWCQRSADGAKIAYQYQDPQGIATLRWLDLRDVSAAHEPLAEYGITRLVSSLAWSPVGSTLAFSACRAENDCRLYMLDVDRGELRELAQVSSPWPVLWKPDGSELAVISPDETGGETAQTLSVFRVLDGTLLYSGSASYPNVPADAPVSAWGVTFPAGAQSFSGCEAPPER